MRLRRQGFLLPALALASGVAAPSGTAAPFHGCTFYKAPFVGEFAACAEFSAVRGRRQCEKTKGVPPAIVRYPGDDVEMWLPDYFIEVTKHFGRSLFAEVSDGGMLKAQLSFGRQTWPAPVAQFVPKLANGAESASAADSFWHARILTVPYGSLSSNYPPLSASKGVGPPACFTGLSEFYFGQWSANLADAPYAAAYASVGSEACLSPGGATAVSIGRDVRAAVTRMNSGLGASPSYPMDVTCATPVVAKEALFKNGRPGSDALSPLTDPSRLCIGSWGNVVPRTGWITTEDPTMSALIAAYKFQSLVADLHLNGDARPRADDKWQVVYPPQASSRCFRPGSLTHIPPADDLETRARAELKAGDRGKHHTYVIAVWRRRHSCEEPLFGGWNEVYRINFEKNRAICSASPGL